MKKKLYINLIRSDMSDQLVHFTNSFNSLRMILSQRCLTGSNKNILGEFKCVCFSEAPLTKIKSLIGFCEKYGKMVGEEMHYTLFGVSVKKEWLFRFGGRPVIYQPEEEYEQLSDHHRHLHVNFDPLKNIDLTWEREWRVKTDTLKLDPRYTLVFVKNRNYVDKLLHDEEIEKDDGLAFPWHVISLEEIS